MKCSRCHRPVATFERHDPDADEHVTLVEPCWCGSESRYIGAAILLCIVGIVCGLFAVAFAEVYR